MVNNINSVLKRYSVSNLLNSAFNLNSIITVPLINIHVIVHRRASFMGFTMHPLQLLIVLNAMFIYSSIQRDGSSSVHNYFRPRPIRNTMDLSSSHHCMKSSFQVFCQKIYIYEPTCMPPPPQAKKNDDINHKWQVLS